MKTENADKIVSEAKERGIALDDVLAFARVHALPCLLRGVLSLCVVIALLALGYAVVPRQSSWQQEVAITLPKEGGQTVYPSGRLFSSADLLSAPVLTHVWQAHKLQDKVPFEDFCKWFSIVGYNAQRARLDAEYQTKMSKRNVTITELESLQREYEAKLEALAADNRYRIAMRPTCVLSSDACVEILSAIPQAWFDEYSVLNAARIPSVIRAEVLSSYVQRIKTAGARSLELVDTLRLYEREISATCKYVRDGLLRGRNVMLDGVDIGAYEARLELVRAELLRFKNRVMSHGDPTDLEGFVAARLDDMACETLLVEEKMKAVHDTIDLLKDTTPRAARGTVRSGSVAGENAVTVQADASFFHDFADMVRRDSNQQAVQRYADELSDLAKQLADIKSRKLYYTQIEEYARKTRANKGAPGPGTQNDKLFADVEQYSSEMLDIGAKVLAYRDHALKIYRTSDQFFALPESVVFARSFLVSPLRMALGLLALWLLYNLAYVVLAWNKRRGE